MLGWRVPASTTIRCESACSTIQARGVIQGFAEHPRVAAPCPGRHRRLWSRRMQVPRRRMPHPRPWKRARGHRSSSADDDAMSLGGCERASQYDAAIGVVDDQLARWVLLRPASGDAPGRAQRLARRRVGPVWKQHLPCAPAGAADLYRLRPPDPETVAVTFRRRRHHAEFPPVTVIVFSTSRFARSVCRTLYPLTAHAISLGRPWDRGGPTDMTSVENRTE